MADLHPMQEGRRSQNDPKKTLFLANQTLVGTPQNPRAEGSLGHALQPLLACF